ncbi:hypothetical protein Taro_047505 [Colocasia esculenta]|uniref:Receptor-like serine/threonine-protein kinase n=1 Tax=Colocasia esculenta TaxID=4460 RepID=A0A843X7Y1_COLES|nr:hypothetical protein [Colocasia esculenta]
MGSFFLISAFIVFLSSFCAADDRLAAGQSISVNQTIVSTGQIFALGFFTAENTDAAANLQYVGIWYNRLPERTVVWVANRETPLRDPAGFLTVTEDGNIAVLDGMGRTVWSTNLTGVPSNASAVLLDSGNLVLRDGSGNDVWQSFDHPADTRLPGMKLRVNLTTGVGSRLTSWRGAADPSPGQFVFTADPNNPLQDCIFNGSEMFARMAPWDGKAVTTYGQPWNNDSLIVGRTVKGDDDIFVSFSMANNSLFARSVLDYTGKLTLFIWVERFHKWVFVGCIPLITCDLYSWCGPFAVCVYTQSSCRCLDGFEPRSPEEWKMENFTGGCVRRLQLQCDGTDRFVKFPGMKPPDGFSVMWNKSMQQCEAECSTGCRCQGYAYADIISVDGGISGSRCLIWLGEMKDLVQTPYHGEDLYVRLQLGMYATFITFCLMSHAIHFLLFPCCAAEGIFSRKSKNLIKIIIAILSLGMLLTVICCYFSIKMYKSRVSKRSRKIVPPQGLGITSALGSEKELPDVALFDFKIVKAATSSFSSENRLGEGGFGSVYKGTFLSGQEVAIKRLSKGSKQGYQEFHNEVRLIARLQHKNLVQLLGWCTHKDEKILIYEYMPNKSLDKIIFGLSLFLIYPTRSAELNWEKRFDIIKGIANGLLYLHQHSRMRVIHRDLKTSNVLLDSEMNPKISDFGLARTFQTNQDKGSTQRVVGTYGYMSPEYAMNGVFSEKSDVFSFGVILLEIIIGKRSTGFHLDKNYRSLFGYAWQMWEGGRGLELLDPSMLRRSSWATEVLRCTQLAMLCIQEDAADRPNMSSVVFSLSSDTCTLPMPNKPAFVFGRGPNPILPASHDNAVEASINELTGTSVEGR